jgi:hypothetical protein
MISREEKKLVQEVVAAVCEDPTAIDSVGNDVLALLDEAADDLATDAKKDEPGLDEDGLNALITTTKLVALRAAMDTVLNDLEDDLAEAVRTAIYALPKHLVPEPPDDGDGTAVSTLVPPPVEVAPAKAGPLNLVAPKIAK